MKWAAKAGMVDPSIPNHLIIAYEPECASLSVLYDMFDNGLLTFKFNFIIYYLKKKIFILFEMITNESSAKQEKAPGATKVKDEKKESEDEKKRLLRTGDAYIMLDLREGTTDIACHEIKGPFEVKELLAPSGGAWGSYYIDKTFEFMLIEIFGSDHMNEFKAIHPGKYRELMSNFERNKCDFFKDEYNNSNSNSNNSVSKPGKARPKFHSVTLPIEFDIFMQGKYEDIEQVVNDFQFYGKPCQIQYIATCLRMSHEVWMKMFDDLIDLIIVHTTTLINTNAELLKHKLKCICLVGGFSKSEYLHKRITDEFAAHYHIFLPRYHILSVVDGAARIGKISNFVKSRIVNKTYGVSRAVHVLEATNSGVSADHIQNHKFTTSDGQEFVNNCFDVFIRKGEEINVDQVVEHEFGSSKVEWWGSSFDYIDTTTIYSSDEKNPLVVSGLKPLATLYIRLPRELQSNKLKVSNRFYFGNTTLRVTTLITTTDGKCIEKEVYLDYDYSIEKPSIH
ncbi:hypothetical protein RFI_01659 [Reticulomyxa filosa]|uniref:Uncharacterized protein n=1 Tax=Reticulomyxa filosa TaxID=46433 RepID=X6PB74_RETFI|nr:hypothetical protein RFI_01659 [Reticulomyxa filosa]|eukprot:ETO35406.1 hypothetical protein RFI_01659 [Reticulomyxa filosa]